MTNKQFKRRLCKLVRLDYFCGTNSDTLEMLEREINSIEMARNKSWERNLALLESLRVANEKLSAMAPKYIYIVTLPNGDKHQVMAHRNEGGSFYVDGEGLVARFAEFVSIEKP